MRINMITVPHEEQRYDTAGDWYYEGEGFLNIVVSEMPDWRYEFLVGLHELIEAMLCKHADVTQEMVDEFDMKWTATSNPGESAEAPYHDQHKFASEIEFAVAEMLGVNWLIYEAALEKAMPNFNLSISEETVELLLSIGETIKLPDELTTEEKLELVIDAIANSVDSTLPIAADDEGKPLQYKDALDAIMNPNITSVFKAPTTAQPVSTSLTWAQIEAIMGVPKDADVPDDITKEAMVIVFNELPQDEWSSLHAEALIDKTIELLRHKQAAGEEV